MNLVQWNKISDLFEAALNCPVDQRAKFLEECCSDDLELQLRVEAMLAADEQEDLLLDRPAHSIVDPSAPTLCLSESEFFTNETIGDYRLIKELGRGGMGTVYLAYDQHLERQAALKLLPLRYNSPERVLRLQREARAASALNHPNIITIYDFGQENGRDFIASEYVEGHTLRADIGNADLTLNQILDVTIQVASALETAHAAGIIHRDIKPENIMLRPDGYAKVLDFGLAKLNETGFGSDEPNLKDTAQTSAFETRTGVLLGTVNYMSPEQVRGQKLDGRTDLFSLGVVLYELITGHRPFNGPTFHHTMVAITDAEPPPIARYVQDTPAHLQLIISRVLHKDRERRYQNARELLSDLERLQDELAADALVERIEAGHSGENRFAEMTTPLMAGHVSVASDLLKPGRPVQPFQYLRQRWRTVTIAALVLIAAATSVYFGHGFVSRAPVLTEKDTILLADFTNTTGDPDFDGTLKLGLTVQLEQSPYINIYPEERARETLALMERSRDAAITREIAREICQRRGINVLMVGTIASLGRNYVITLEAVNSQSGEALALQQTEAEGKEQVLKALGRAATQMREKLGESLASIRKFDVPIEQATTSSLEAFKNYVLAAELRRRGQYANSIPAYKRAIELDSQFAMAHSQLGTSYRDIRNLALGNEHLVRAYELRDRISERERLEISATYFRYITGELEKRVETTALVTQTYPQEPYGHHIHGNSLMIAGEFEQAAEAYRDALRLDDDYSLARSNLALALIGLNRFDEAREVIQQGMARRPDFSGFHNRLYLLAFLNDDYAEQERQVEWFTGKPDEYQIREFQARSFAFAGRRKEAAEMFEKAAALAEARNLPAEKARILSNEANLNAVVGMTELGKKQIELVLALLKKDGISPAEVQTSLIQQLDSQPVALTVALCGDATLAKSLDEDFSRSFPLDTIHNSIWRPVIRVTLELKRDGSNNNHVASDRAIQLMPPSHQYEAALSFKPTWMRGLAYLQANNGALAAAEFQRIIDHRGWDGLSPLWPLAHLGLARAAVLQGDVPKARKAYEVFFGVWRQADVDLPVLIEAKREYAKL